MEKKGVKMYLIRCMSDGEIPDGYFVRYRFWNGMKQPEIFPVDYIYDGLVYPRIYKTKKWCQREADKLTDNFFLPYKKYIVVDYFEEIDNKRTT